MHHTVRIRVPATTANLGPGFDALGLALDLWNETDFTRREDDRIVVTISGEGADGLPTNAENTVAAAALRLFELAGEFSLGLQIDCRNNIPLSSGMGSSAAAVLTGLLGANALLRKPLDRTAILKLAVELEGHPDNVAPALLGGLVVSLDDGEEIFTYQLPPRPKRTPTHITLVLPEFDFSTRAARAALPSHVRHADAVFNISRAVLVAQALSTGDVDMLAAAMADRLHQPYRLPLIPGAQAAIDAALAAGASGAALSGAGPSLVAFSGDHNTAVGVAMQHAFAKAGLPARVFRLEISDIGAQVDLGKRN